MLRWLALALAVLAFVIASLLWIIMPGLPAFLFPVLAAAGAVLIAWSFVRSLVRFMRQAPGQGRPSVLAPADGRVIVAYEGGDSCGSIIVIEHVFEGYRTIYWHLSAISVKRGDEVKRGVRIGAIGTTGMRAWPGYEHVH